MPVHPTFVLVHGSWHDGHCWSRVRAHLSTAGYPSIAPTLPGHGAGDDRASVTHDDYVAAIDAALDTVDGPVVLVGHSFGGSVISRLAELRPDRCAGLVYYSAFVPRDGERVADSLPAPFIEFLDAAAAASVDRSVALPYELFRDTFANTADEPAASSCTPRWCPNRTVRSLNRSRCRPMPARRSQRPTSPAATIVPCPRGAFIPASQAGCGHAP
jgi:pimeloyl-ACP methyl ester carboxylesterase